MIGTRRAVLALLALPAVAACDEPGAVDSSAASVPGAGAMATTASSESSATSTTFVTLPLADEALDDPEVTTVATDLAPSQVAASTVAPPPTPGPCDPEQLTWWAAGVDVAPDGSAATGVVRVRNVGDVWCEPDIGRSPRLDPAVEPDVWLLPDGEANLQVGHESSSCDAPEVVRQVQVGIGERSVVVPVMAVGCGWWLDAFVPLEPPTGACVAADLSTAVTERAIVIRNDGDVACSVGSVSSDDSGEVVRPADAFVVGSLHPGDVAAIGIVDATASCDDPARSVEVVIEGAGVLVVDGVPCGAGVWSGAPAPWLGTALGPAAEMSQGTERAEQPDVAVLLESADPFAAS